jgi:hypothetical protein
MGKVQDVHFFNYDVRDPVAKTNVTQKKNNFSSLPPGESPTVMATITSKTKEIVVIWAEQ